MSNPECLIENLLSEPIPQVSFKYFGNPCFNLKFSSNLSYKQTTLFIGNSEHEQVTAFPRSWVEIQVLFSVSVCVGQGRGEVGKGTAVRVTCLQGEVMFARPAMEPE